VVAFGFALVFALFGLFVGFASWRPTTGGGSVWGFIWTIVTGFFAVFFGAWAAAKLAGYTDRGISMLHGLATWGLFLGFLALFMGSLTTGIIQAAVPAAATMAAPAITPGGAAGPAAGQVAAGATSIVQSMWAVWLATWLSVIAGLIGAFVGAQVGRPKQPVVRGEAAPEWRRAA